METNNSKSEGSSLNASDISNYENKNTKSVLKCNLCRKEFFYNSHLLAHMRMLTRGLLLLVKVMQKLSLPKET